MENYNNTDPADEIIDFDGNWKDIIEEFFKDFVLFFLPELHKDVDFSVPPVYMDKEYLNIIDFMGLDKKIADKLVKVQLKDGKQRMILIHIEIQSYFERLFSRRMFLMNAYTIGRFDEDIVAIAIYTNAKTPKNFDRYERRAYGTETLFRFLAYKVMKQKEADLLASDNILALFVLANKYTNETRGESNQRKRLKLKEKLFELALAKQIDLQKIQRLLIFVNNIMLLPLDLKTEFYEFISNKAKKTPAMRNYIESNKELANLFAHAVYGETLEDIQKTREQEQKMHEEKQRMLEQEQKMREQAIIKLYAQKISTIPQIADIFGLEIAEIERIVFG